MSHFGCLWSKCNLRCTALFIYRLRSKKKINKPSFLAPHWLLLYPRRMAQSGISSQGAARVCVPNTALGWSIGEKISCGERIAWVVAQLSPQEPNAVSGQPLTTTALLWYLVQLKNICQALTRVHKQVVYLSGCHSNSTQMFAWHCQEPAKPGKSLFPFQGLLPALL